MGASLQNAIMLYGAGSLMGTASYLLIIVFQQFLGSSLGRLFFTLDYTEMMVNACYSGLWALIFMFSPYDKYKNVLIALFPALTYLAYTRGGIKHVLSNFDLSLFTTYETPLILASFIIVWGLGVPKVLKQI